MDGIISLGLVNNFRTNTQNEWVSIKNHVIKIEFSVLIVNSNLQKISGAIIENLSGNRVHTRQISTIG